MYILDLNAPKDNIHSEKSDINFLPCNVASWSELRGIFARVGHIDMVFANAGVSEETDYFQDTYDNEGLLLEPRYRVIDVNYRAVLNVVKLSLSAMRKQKTGGSIVLTTSATAYAPEQSLPVYSATKLAVSFCILLFQAGIYCSICSIIHALIEVSSSVSCALSALP